jgi:hypothetical protein
MSERPRPYVDVRFSADVSVLDRNRLVVVLRALASSVAVLADLVEANVAARLLVAGTATDAAEIELAAGRWLTTSARAGNIVMVQRAGTMDAVIRSDRHTRRRRWPVSNRFSAVSALRPAARQGPRVLMLADEWLPRLGGLSAFNRYLSVALARSGADVSCLLPQMSDDEIADAAAADVMLVKDVTDTLFDVPPDAVIGHGRVTGELARTLTSTRFASSARLHVVHAAPDEVGWHKPLGPDPVLGVEERTQAEVDLCVDADGARRIWSCR